MCLYIKKCGGLVQNVYRLKGQQGKVQIHTLNHNYMMVKKGLGVCVCSSIRGTNVTASKPLRVTGNFFGRVGLPRLDSTASVITSTLFSLSVTVYQLTVTQKYSSFSYRHGRRQYGENQIQKEK